jgi:hypothetical protein
MPFTQADLGGLPAKMRTGAYPVAAVPQSTAKSAPAGVVTRQRSKASKSIASEETSTTCAFRLRTIAASVS